MKGWITLFGFALVSTVQAQTFIFKDWAVACDNTRHCEAVGYQSDDSESAPVVMWISRDAGPGSPVAIQLETEEGDAPLALKLGKKVLDGVLRGKDLSAAQARQVLSYLQTGEEILISEGTRKWQLSLAGSSAALLKIDDLQGRIGTPGALVRKGSKPEQTVPVALPPSKVAVVNLPGPDSRDEPLLAAILKSIPPRECSEGLPDDAQPESFSSRVSKNQILVVRECSRGAYQSSYGIWLANSKPPYAAQRLTLPTPYGQATDEVMGASLDNGRLDSFAKGRGVSDCAEGMRWAWSGTAFALLDAWKAPLCKGLAAGGYSLRTWIAQETVEASNTTRPLKN